MSEPYIYGTYNGSLEDNNVHQACAICHAPLIFNRQRSFPDYLCMHCHRQWPNDLHAEWLLFLVRIEHARRMRITRKRQRGEWYEVISYDRFAEATVTQDGTDDDDYNYAFGDDDCFDEDDDPTEG